MKRISVFLSIVLLFSACLFACGEPTPVYEIRFSTSLYYLKDGESEPLKYTVKKDGEVVENAPVSFTSDHPEIAEVSQDGTVTGVSEGVATVTASVGGASATARVSVSMRSKSVTLSEKSVALLSGQQKQLTATYKIGGEEQAVTFVWTSANEDIATVSGGLITAKSGGKTTVTATYNGVSASAEVVIVQTATAQQVNSFSEEYINIYGRSYKSSGALRLDHTANAVEVGVNGSALSVNLTTTANSYMQVFVDGKAKDRINVTPSVSNYTVASGLSEGYHKIRIVKATEMSRATWTLNSFSADGFVAVEEKDDLKIEFLGDSILAGYGALGMSGEGFTVENSDCSKGYAYLTAHSLNADYSVIAWSGIATKAFVWGGDLNMINLYPRLSYASQTPYDFSFNPDIVVINLGTNESSYLSTNSAYGTQFPADYKELLTLVRQKNPSAKIICVYGAMGVNSTIESGIKTAIENMSDNNIVYNPFEVIENRYGANGHPTAAAQQRNADALALYIKSLQL